MQDMQNATELVFSALFIQMTFTDYPYNNLRNKFGAHLTDEGFDLLNRSVRVI